jgi:AcrR family transcriptional regulator
MFVHISSEAFVKNPISSELGIRIVQNAIILMNRNGVNEFTFRKLAQHLCTSEASIYRYFESKMQLLNFLSQLYWHEVKELILEEIIGVHTSEDKIIKAIEIFCNPHLPSKQNSFVDMSELHQLIIQEGVTTNLWGESHQTDDHSSQKRLIQYLSEVILSINPNYSYPKTLISTMIHTCHLQLLFCTHLPYYTDISAEDLKGVVSFVSGLILSTIKNGTV